MKKPKMKNIVLIISLLFSINIFSQTIEYSLFNIERQECQLNLKGFKLSSQYDYGEYKIVVGELLDRTSEEFGLRLFVFNGKNDLLFQTKGQLESFFISPYFFINNKRKTDFFIIAEIGTEYSWGAHAIKVSNGKVSYIGHMDIAVNKIEIQTEEYTEYLASKIFKDLLITQNEDSIKFHFRPNNIMVIGPGRTDEMEMNSENVWYEYKEGKLELKMK